jgi:hypothetical protein
MSDLQEFIKHCKDNHPGEFVNLNEEYEAFKVGVMLSCYGQTSHFAHRHI